MNLDLAPNAPGPGPGSVPGLSAAEWKALVQQVSEVAGIRSGALRSQRRRRRSTELEAEAETSWADGVAWRTAAAWGAVRMSQSKQGDGATRMEAAQRTHDALRACVTAAESGAAPAPLDPSVQPLLVNALLHLLLSSTGDPSLSLASLSSLGLLLAHPSLLSQRVGVVVRKLRQHRCQMQQRRGLQQQGGEEIAEAIDQLLGAHPALVAAVAAEDAAAAAAPAEASSAAAERKAARVAKEARKQAELGEKRRRKLIEQQQQQQQQKQPALATSTDATPAAVPAAAAPLPDPSDPAFAAPPAPDVRDGTESAPYGNFHNYYSFNAPQQRLQFVPSQMATEILRRKRERRRRERELEQRGGVQGSASGMSSAAPAADPGAAEVERETFAFLDVGCNEGDLTLALMQHLLAGLRGETDTPTIAQVDARAAGTAAPAPAAVPAIAPITPSSAPFRSAQMHALGVDIDPELIGRAQAKVAPTLVALRQRLQAEDAPMAAEAAAARGQGGASATPLRARPTPLPTVRFDTVDVMQPGASEQLRAMLALSVAEAGGAAAAPSPSPSSLPAPSSPPFDLVCCYSITLWIHLHHGDAGLRLFLSSLSALASNLILEPQPWRCYRNARERWRRCGKEDPPHMAGLRWRGDVEERMVEYLTQELGMRLRADLGSTKWQRRVLWFERP